MTLRAVNSIAGMRYGPPAMRRVLPGSTDPVAG